jgi:hypothetical protein
MSDANESLIPLAEYLPALFRKILQGKLRVPAFQREFVWKNEQALELVESVHRNFPIGSLLFWKVDERKLRSENPPAPFPTTQEAYPLTYVLDGLQRLSVLFGAFHVGEGPGFAPFRVAYDLRRQVFLNWEDEDIALPIPGPMISLDSLFKPKVLLQEQARLLLEADGGELVDRSVALQTAFQNYMVPTVTIEGRSIQEVVAIFERVNNTGTKLGAVDFLRALTWSHEFDLGQELDAIEAVTKDAAFAIPSDNLTKLFAVVMGQTPNSEQMLALRTTSAIDLQAGARRTEDASVRAVRHLAERFGIYGYDLVPYEGEFVVLAWLYSAYPNPGDDLLNLVDRWLWSVSLNEGLRGKPDHYITRAIAQLGKAALGQSNTFEQRLRLTAEDLQDRRFTSGKALSAAFLWLMRARGARSLSTGDGIPAESYMTTFDPENLVGLVGPAVAGEAGVRRVFANLVLATSTERRWLSRTPGSEIARGLLARGDSFAAVLDSQCLPREALVALCAGNHQEFLMLRSRAILEVATSLTQSP